LSFTKELVSQPDILSALEVFYLMKLAVSLVFFMLIRHVLSAPTHLPTFEPPTPEPPGPSNRFGQHPQPQPPGPPNHFRQHPQLLTSLILSPLTFPGTNRLGNVELPSLVEQGLIARPIQENHGQSRHEPRQHEGPFRSCSAPGCTLSVADGFAAHLRSTHFHKGTKSTTTFCVCCLNDSHFLF